MIIKHTSTNLPANHGFYTRLGGVSKGIYEGLNCGIGSNDNPDHVVQNRQLVADDLGVDKLISLYQCHGNDVVFVDEHYDMHNRPRADAMVCTTPQVALGILTADCAPVLLVDPINGVIGAAHAGWRGALAGIVPRTITKMVEHGAKMPKISLVIGPLIAPESYQVSQDFTDQFMAQSPDNAQFFMNDGGGKYHFNLPAYILYGVQGLGLQSAEWLGFDTYSNPDKYFSNRYATHHNHGDYGRLISCIRL